MMQGVALIFFWSLLSQVASQEIKVECYESDDLPPLSSRAPSQLADLKVTVGGDDMLNITWAINIDGSIASLEGTHIQINGEPYYCEYQPHLSKAKLTGSDQKWFHFLVEASYGYNVILASNIPLPLLGSGQSYIDTAIVILKSKSSTEAPPTTTAALIAEPTASALTVQDVTLIIFGGLAGLMLLSSCYVLFFRCSTGAPLGFHHVESASTVPVLVVYPAEDSAFQQAVLALAEFLQWRSGCSVALDMWQQGKIAELGPMRWLAEQVKSAERVIVVSPQPGPAPPHRGLPAPSVPAAAYDLYPLILNMVGSHAKSASQLSKFYVVQLAARAKKSTFMLPSELRACKTFCLMEDLNKLSNSLHARKEKSKSRVSLIFKPRVSYNEKSTEKLREAVEKLGQHQTLKSGVHNV
ncbi:uncharacterized protein il17rb [Salarias fasciatus]|uniref:Uncharacterized LOC115407937 n=1 Tax=Salarias fasciatus TaxID=181472 RepID=A0A672GTN8_SALFA|nr:uncharacterized protein LOC115407937 [Salarias fasciatus]